MDVHPAADEFLRQRLWGTLATGRASGAPQVSLVAYDWNGIDLVISCRRNAAKYANASVRPDVAFIVVDGIDACTVTGRALCNSTGVARDVATERLAARLRRDAGWAGRILDADIATGLDVAERAIIIVEPTSINLVQPRGQGQRSSSQ